MNTDVLFSSKSALHTTPRDLFAQLHREFRFVLDAAADSSNHLCANWFGPDSNLGITDALSAKPFWRAHGENIWCNPPYGRGMNLWMEKAYESSLQNGLVVMLVPARTGTKWFQSYAFKPNVERRFITGRLRFGNPDSKGNSAPFDSMVLVFKPEGGGPYTWRTG